jgi:hypothetical protein
MVIHFVDRPIEAIWWRFRIHQIERIKYIRSLLAMAPRVYCFLLSILLDELGLQSELLRFA